MDLILINNRKGKGSEFKKSPIEIRITHARKVKYISTGVSVTTTQWNAKSQRIVGRLDSDVLNEVIYKKLNTAERIAAEMLLLGVVDLQGIADKLKAKTLTITFPQYIRRCGQHRSIKVETQKKYESTANKLEEFRLLKTFSDVNENGIKKLDRHLKNLGLSQDTIWSYHKIIKACVKMAIVDEYLAKNPYDGFKVEKGKPRCDKFVTQDELAKIRTIPLVGSELNKCRDLFVFQAYTGMAYGDCMSFSRDMVEDGMIIGERVKNGKDYRVLLLPPALEILEKWNYELPKISNQQYNETLKLIASACEIAKPLTTHWARHTAGMMFLNNGIPIEVVSKILGHSSIRITETTYAKILDNSVRREMKKVAELV